MAEQKKKSGQICRTRICHFAQMGDFAQERQFRIQQADTEKAFNYWFSVTLRNLCFKNTVLQKQFIACTAMLAVKMGN